MHGKPKGLQWRKDVFTRQPSKETGEQASGPPPQRPGAWNIYGIRKQGGLRHGEGWLQVGKRWGSQCPVQVYLGYMLLHGMHVQKWRYLAWPEGGDFGPLMSKNCSSDNCADTVLGSVIPASLSQLELDRIQLHVLVKQLKPTITIVTCDVRGFIYRGG